MQIVHKLSVDLQRPSTTTIYVKQGDKLTRYVELSLHNAGSDYTPANANILQIVFVKPDRTGGVYDTMPDGETACTIEGNVVTAILHPQMFTCPGVVKCELRMLNSEGTQILSTFGWLVNVEPSSEGEIASESYYRFASIESLAAVIGDLDDLKTQEKNSIVGAINEVAKIEVVARAADGYSYSADVEGLEISVGTEIVLLPQSNNQGAATLALNGGTAYPLCLRPGWNVTGDDLHPQLTLPLESGMLLRGGEYIFRFDGAAWVLQSYVVQPGVYVQDEEPAWTEDGSVWIDTDEEPEEADTVTAEELEEALSIAAQEQKAYVDEAIAQAGGSGGAAATDITDQVMEWTLGLDGNLSGALTMFYIASLVQMQYGPGRYIAFGGTAQFDVYYSEDLLQGQIRAQVQSSSVELSFATGSDEEVRHNGYVFYVDPYTNKREMLNIVDGQFVAFGVTGLAEPTEDSGAANKKYVDDAIAAALAAIPIAEERSYG